MLIQKETFDYIKWQENLFEDMTIAILAGTAKSTKAPNELDMGKVTYR
jgi:hypothetical protein